MRKIVVIDQLVEKAMDEVCDAALKFAGIKMFSYIQTLSNAVKMEEEPKPIPVPPIGTVQADSLEEAVEKLQNQEQKQTKFKAK